ncbi:MAG: protein-disulfide reductase DsbD domain-containing protein [Hyphomicrobium sp.]
MRAEIASPWVELYNNKIRLLAGGSDGRSYAAIEIVMPKDWKTYWRNPGEAGGIPPTFDWSQSVNVARVDVLYPAPHTLIDKAGATYGYKDAVVFPVVITPKDASLPIELKLKAEYGICKDICVPSEAEVSLALPAGGEPSASDAIAEALARVPSTSPRAGIDPTLVAATLDTSGAAAVLHLDVKDLGEADGEAFVEGPDGVFVPRPILAAAGNGSGNAAARFDVDVSDKDVLAALKAGTLKVTLVGAKGQSELPIKLN